MDPEQFQQILDLLGNTSDAAASIVLVWLIGDMLKPVVIVGLVLWGIYKIVARVTTAFSDDTKHARETEEVSKFLLTNFNNVTGKTRRPYDLMYGYDRAKAQDEFDAALAKLKGEDREC